MGHFRDEESEQTPNTCDVTTSSSCSEVTRNSHTCPASLHWQLEAHVLVLSLRPHSQFWGFAIQTRLSCGFLLEQVCETMHHSLLEMLPSLAKTPLEEEKMRKSLPLALESLSDKAISARLR